MSSDVLHVPSREEAGSTNAWAFMHWLDARHGIRLADWADLQMFSSHPDFVGHLDGFGGPIASADLGFGMLFLDLRPDDTVLRFSGDPTDLPDQVARAGVSVVIASETCLTHAAYLMWPKIPTRIVTVGGPMIAPARAALYQRLKPGPMLLAAAGALVWGNPLDPVRLTPAPAPALGVGPPDASLPDVRPREP